MRRMEGFSVRVSCALALSAALFASGCAIQDDSQVAAQAVEKARPNWKVQLDWAGGKVELPVNGMDIYLVEEDDEYPEIFEITGEGLALVGSFPMDLHVGYEEAFERMIGKPVPFSPSGGDPREPKNSYVRIDGNTVPVSGGTFTVEKVTGKWSGNEGDKTLWGTITLRIPGAAGEQTVTGRLAVRAVTWG